MSVSLVNTSATTLVATQMTNITSEEKQNLLFDVNCSLEVQMEDFDEIWWPLVSNIWTQWTSYKQTRPSGLCHAKIKVEWLVSLKIVKVGCYKDSSNHTHSLLDVNRLKRPQIIRTLVEKEAVKNYSPLAITATIKEYTTIELGLDASAQCKEVTNIKYKVRGPMEVHLVGNSDLKLDISQSVSYLK
ncbi:5390_t:CDS:2, partial [Rhizophagus irregularis]